VAITYTEFDTTPAGLIAALRTNILANTHWSDLGVVDADTTNSIATTSAGNTATLNSATGFTVGQWITVNVGATEVYKQITAVAGNVITISTTWGAIFAIGTSFRARSTVLKSTTDNGTDLILDLEGDLQSNYINVIAYRQWTGTAPGGWTDAKPSWLYWRAAGGGALTMPIHVTLSVGKNHLFFAIEGPRSNETGATSATYGSIKNYFAISELTKYHAGDTGTPAISIGVPSSTATTSVNAGGHQVGISRDAANTVSWGMGRLASLDWPTVGATDVVSMNRTCTIDGKVYLLPYVLFSETEGIRGRLSNLFFANTTAPSPLTDLPDPVGTRVTYNGIVYKLIALNKGDGAIAAWGPFGAVTNSTSVTRSIILAVPYAVAA
jgi:hypothetical protein